jgi:hypothetical protein
MIGAKVFYSVERDNDDTLAEYAYHYNARYPHFPQHFSRYSILSQDTDFFRYGYPFKVYDKFVIEDGKS